MYRHLGLQRVSVPSLGRGGSRPTEHATPKESSGIGFGTAVGLTTSIMVVGAAVITAAPDTVTASVATLLGSGVIAGAIVAVRNRVASFRRRMAAPSA